MIGQNNPMANYTVYKPTLEQQESFRELPPNYHLRKARSTKAVEIPNKFEQIDTYVPAERSLDYSKYRKEEENVLNLFKRLNARLFGQNEATRIDRTEIVTERKIATRTEKEEQIYRNQVEKQEQTPVHPILQNNWWNSLGVLEERRAPVVQEMTKKLQNWCQMEYDQTRELDEAFYTPQQLRDRIALFKEINEEFDSMQQKKILRRAEQQHSYEPWDLVTPLPISPDAIETYRAMDDDIIDDEESYRNMYYSSTFERVA